MVNAILNGCNGAFGQFDCFTDHDTHNYQGEVER